MPGLCSLCGQNAADPSLGDPPVCLACRLVRHRELMTATGRTAKPLPRRPPPSCVDCGRLDVPVLADGLCEICRGLRMWRLGIPEEADCWRVTAVLRDRAGRRSPYRWEGFGVRHHADATPPGPTYRLEGAFVVQLWHQTIRQADSPIHVEAHWRPGGEQVFTPHVPQSAVSNRRAVEAAWRGIGLLWRARARKRGRKARVSNYADAARTKKDARQALRLLREGTSRANVAKRFNVHPTTIDRWAKWAESPEFDLPE